MEVNLPKKLAHKLAKNGAPPAEIMIALVNAASTRPAIIEITNAKIEENLFVLGFLINTERSSPDKNPYAASSTTIGISPLGNGGLPLDIKETSGVRKPQISPNHCPHNIPAKNTGRCIALNSDAIFCPAKWWKVAASITPKAHSIAVVTIFNVLKVFADFFI